MSIPIRCWDSNQKPSEHELSLITTRPGLPPKSNFHSFRSKSIDDYFSEFTFGVMPIVLRSLEVGKSLSNDLVTIRLDVSGDLQLVRNVVQSDNKTTTLQNIFQNLLWHTQTKGREVKR